MIDCFWIWGFSVKNILQKMRMSTLREKSNKENNSYAFNVICVHYKTAAPSRLAFLTKQPTVLKNISAAVEWYELYTQNCQVNWQWNFFSVNWRHWETPNTI